MEYVVAQKIRDEWGDKSCEHDHLEKEYYAGAFLTNYVCTRCGREFTIPQKLEMYNGRAKSWIELFKIY